MEEENEITYVKDDITPKEEKGLNMVVKGISKKYPFITGWQPVDNYKLWEGCIFLNLKVDPYKLGEYFNCPLSTWWDKSFKDNPQEYDGQRLYVFRSYLQDDSCLDLDTEYNIKKKMEESLQLMYEIIPEQYSKYYTHTTESIKGMVFKEKPFISEFIMDLSNVDKSS